MTGPIDPLRPFERRQTRRRAEDAPRGAADGGTNVPVVIEQPEPEPHAEPARADGVNAFAAHIYGQGGQKRGLRGGKPVLDAARTAYLETEYSGPDDRRPPKGLLKKTEV